MTAHTQQHSPYPSNEDFTAAVGTAFQLTSDAQQLDAELLRCDIGARTERTEQFSLVLRASSLVAEQGIYHVVHDGLGEFDAFFVPIAQRDGCVELEAVFNLTTETMETCDG